jgi:hypothetical protein
MKKNLENSVFKRKTQIFTIFKIKKNEIKEYFTDNAKYALLFFRFIQTIHDVQYQYSRP